MATPSQRGFSFSTNGQINQNASGIYVAAGMGIVSWEAQNDFSVYDLFALDSEPEVEITYNATDKEVTFSFDSDYEITPNLKEIHTIQMTAAQQRMSRSVEFGTEVSHTDIDDNEVTISNVEPGNYALTIPAGFFRHATSKALSAPVKGINIIGGKKVLVK